MRELGSCFGYSTMMLCEIAEVISRMKTGGEKQDKRSCKRKKFMKSVSLKEDSSTLLV